MKHSDQESVLITGCSTGIGLCLAEGLQNSPYRVIASCRKIEDVEKLTKVGIETLHLDLNDSSSIHQAVEEVMTITRGNLYGLINNGAYGQPGAVEDLSRDALRQQFETNVFGTQELTNLIIAQMRKRNRGRIIQISSILGFVCLKFRGAYNASKFALEALTDTLRLELADTDIKFSLIEPGPIESHFRQNAYAQYQLHIDSENSVYKAVYRQLETRLQQGTPAKYTLPSSAVLKDVRHALDSDNPKIRYRITTPTRVMAPLKRLLPDKWMDRVLLSSGNN